jgi:arsenate reductase
MRILKELDLPSDFILQDIKEDPISVEQLEAMRDLSGSYESLFSRRAKLYKEMGLKDQFLQEMDFKFYILDHYTFLKRPVILVGDAIYTGNSRSTIEAVKKKLGA